MANEWKGFSDKELKDLRQGPRVKVPTPQLHGRSNRPVGRAAPGEGNRATRKNGGPTRKEGVHNNRGPSAHAQNTLPNGAYIVSQPEGGSGENESSISSQASTSPAIADSPSLTVPSSEKERESTKESVTEETPKETKGPNADLSPSTDLSDSPASNLSLLQKKQREMETENKKKKALLEQTLQERYQKSQLEAKTLLKVKAELDKVESLVTRDVAILRNRIEEASRQYNYARRRYEQAEAEFIAAKVELHHAGELKELLSEHLCTVIQQNEARKSQKLAELIEALSIDSLPAESGADSLPSLLFHKTPTPGIDVWPKGRGKEPGSPTGRAEEDGGREECGSGEGVGEQVQKKTGSEQETVETDGSSRRQPERLSGATTQEKKTDSQTSSQVSHSTNDHSNASSQEGSSEGNTPSSIARVHVNSTEVEGAQNVDDKTRATQLLEAVVDVMSPSAISDTQTPLPKMGYGTFTSGAVPMATKGDQGTLKHTSPPSNGLHLSVTSGSPNSTPLNSATWSSHLHTTEAMT